MRLFIAFPDDSGSRKTLRVTINATSTDQFLIEIARKLQARKDCIIVVLKYASLSLRIIEGWPLAHYPIKNGSKIQVVYNQAIFKDSPYTNASLVKIEEVNELQIDEPTEFDGKKKIQLSFISQTGKYDWNQYFDKCLELFLNAVRGGDLEEVAEVLRVQPVVRNQEDLQGMQHEKLKYLLNQIGECGRGAIHWAIHIKNIDILNFLIIKSCDLTVVTIDGSSPLQLAIELRFESGINTLLSHPQLDINQQTVKGSALHSAVLAEDNATVKVLLSKGVDSNILSQEGKTVLDICDSRTIRKLIQQSYVRQKPTQDIPYILKGNVMRVSSISWSLKEKDLQVNPFYGELKVQDHRQVEKKIQLLQIIELFIIKERGWLMERRLSYFKIVYNGGKLTFAVKNKAIAERWIEMIIKNIQYCQGDKFGQKVRQEEQLIEYLDDRKNDIRHHKRKMAETNRRSVSIMDIKMLDELDDTPDQPPKKSIKTPQTDKTNDQKSCQDSLKSDQQGEIEQNSEVSIKRSFSRDQSLDLRESEIIMGSILGEKNFLTPSPSPERSTFNNADFKSQSGRASTPSQWNPEKNTSPFQKRESEAISRNWEIQYSPDDEDKKPHFKDFDIIKLLGNGAFGRVFLAKHRKEEKVYALKVLNKKRLTAKKQLKYAISEANILKRVNSQFLIKLHYSFQTPSSLYLVLDYCPNSDLAEFLIQKDTVSEQTARFIIAQLIEAIDYLHSLGIIYRDLKPENILLRENGYICLADFGLSRERTFSKSFCGSPAYLSPEMLDRKGVGIENDIYGLGCVLYEMVSGEPPYYDDNIDQLYENIKSGKLRYPSHVSKSAKSLISRLLERNIRERIGVKDKDEIRNHPFFYNFNWEKLKNSQLQPPKELIPEKIDELKLMANENHGFTDEDYLQSQSMVNRIKNFTFSREDDSEDESPPEK